MRRVACKMTIMRWCLLDSMSLGYHFHSLSISFVLMTMNPSWIFSFITFPLIFVTFLSHVVVFTLKLRLPPSLSLSSPRDIFPLLLIHMACKIFSWLCHTVWMRTELCWIRRGRRWTSYRECEWIFDSLHFFQSVGLRAWIRLFRL